jgi:hypothetical protein
MIPGVTPRSEVTALARWLAAPALLAAAAAAAGEADVLAARATCDASRVCRFEVTVSHADSGWEHYADRFEVLAPDGEVLATRVLRHPHVQEQPVTRDLVGARVPAGVDRVTIRAHDSQHGFGGTEVEIPVSVPQEKL